MIPQAAPAFPLEWPAGRPRTQSRNRQPSKFGDGSFAVVRDGLLKELKRLGAKYVVLSTNIELRGDGLPYANRRNPDDPGVAVYFADKKGRKIAFACDRWLKIEDNLRAIQKTIESIRGIERWGTGDAVDAAFSGFLALPPVAKWATVLECDTGDRVEVVEQQYRMLSFRNHPDRGGDPVKFRAVNDAYDDFKRERGI